MWLENLTGGQVFTTVLALTLATTTWAFICMFVIVHVSSYIESRTGSRFLALCATTTIGACFIAVIVSVLIFLLG